MYQAVVAVLCTTIIFAPSLLLAKEKPIIVAVIDTGISKEVVRKPDNGICKSGHIFFTGKRWGIYDNSSHGTNVAGLIHKHAKGADYCQIHYKYYEPLGRNNNNLRNVQMSLKAAIEARVDVINFSGGGLKPSSMEHALILKALDSGIKVVASAGNEGAYLRASPYYPASYDPRIFVIGGFSYNTHKRHTMWGLNESVYEEPEIWSMSNYGDPVDCYENAVNQVGAYGAVQSGTSQAAAIFTGKLVYLMHSVKSSLKESMLYKHIKNPISKTRITICKGD